MTGMTRTEDTFAMGAWSRTKPRTPCLTRDGLAHLLTTSVKRDDGLTLARRNSDESCLLSLLGAEAVSAW